MASTDAKKGAADPKKPAAGKKLSPEEIYNGFQQLRQEQRNLVNKLSEVEMDLNEHKMVLETLKDLDGNRKCYRLIGGVLCEKAVKDVIPQLTTNKEQLTSLAESLNDQITKKGQEINDYKEKHSIGVRGVDDPPPSPAVPAEGEKSSAESGPMRIMVNPI